MIMMRSPARPDELLRGAFLALLLEALSLTPAAGQSAKFSDLQAGKALVAAGDCAACHTADHGKPFAGGRPLETPFGTIYSSNITPDKSTGIGNWTSDQFYRAMHEGISPGHENLYPAFPYPWFTKVRRSDVDAIFSYLQSLPAVRQSKPDNRIPWPLSQRKMMVGWNTLYFKKGTFQPDPKMSAEWNRGAYLVEGLGHCGACHSPRNVLGAAKKSRRFEGETTESWFAPDLNGDERTGLGRWSKDDIVSFLKTGHSGKTVAYGPMAQVVSDSTSKLSDSDLASIATYLKSLPPAKKESIPRRPASALMQAGEAIYRDNCSACHKADGSGVGGMFPALRNDAMLQAARPETAIRLVLEGGHSVAVPGNFTAVGMPAFGWKLSDAQVAAVLSYLRNSLGNAASPVTEGQVRSVQNRLQSSAVSQ